MASQLFAVEFDPLNIDNTVQSMSNFLEKQVANLMTQQGAAKLLKECQKYFRKSEFCFDVDPDLLMFSNTKLCRYTKLRDWFSLSCSPKHIESILEKLKTRARCSN